jgi:hypothetical protein
MDSGEAALGAFLSLPTVVFPSSFLSPLSSVNQPAALVAREGYVSLMARRLEGNIRKRHRGGIVTAVV